MAALERTRALAFVASLIITALIGSVHVILPAALILLLPGFRGAYRCVVDAVATWWFHLAAALIEWLGGTQVVLSGDGAAPPSVDERVSVIICNHNCRLDWLFLWPFIVRQGTAGRLKIALKEPMKMMPFFGWAMQAFLFVFLSRANRGNDLAHVSALLEHMRRQGDAMTLLFFPEGTDLSPSNLAKSHAHAEAAGLPKTARTLLPRTAGFMAVVEALGPALDAVYDLTVSYELHPTVAASEDPRPSEVWMLRGANPVAVRIHATRYARSELPADAEGLKAWLLRVWADKEARIAAAASDGGAALRSPPPAGKYAAALASAALAVALLARGLLLAPALVSGGTLAGCALLSVASRQGGLERIEMRRCGAGGRTRQKDE